MTYTATYDPADTPPPVPGEKFKQLQAALKAGVKVVSAPQLFPTPPDIARRLVQLADVQAGQRILEPSAGTGNLVRAIWDATTGPDTVFLLAVEINYDLAERLKEIRNRTVGATEANSTVRRLDFMELDPATIPPFDRIVMNPPFERGSDIRHILHARRFLKPGGRLAAFLANGPRQQEQLQPIAREWIELPAGSFENVGTSVNTAIIILDHE